MMFVVIDIVMFTSMSITLAHHESSQINIECFLLTVIVDHF